MLGPVGLEPTANGLLDFLALIGIPRITSVFSYFLSHSYLFRYQSEPGSYWNPIPLVMEN